MAVKKMQAVKFWRELRDSTELEQVLIKYQNKPGYAGKRTLQRYAQADRGFRDSIPLEQLASQIGLSTSQLSKIHPWWQEAFGPVSGVTSIDQDKHRDDLTKPLLDLRAINTMNVHDFDLATFWSRPGEQSWPLDQCRVWRKPDGGLEVRLKIEEETEWIYLRQHLVDDHLWSAVESCKTAIADDVIARMALLEAVIRRIETASDQGGLDWPVILKTGSGFLNDAAQGEDGKAVSLYFAFLLLDQALSRNLALAHGVYEDKDFMMVNEFHIDLGGNPVAFAHYDDQHKAAIKYFLKAQVDLVSLPESQRAAETYHAAGDATNVVKGHLDRLRLTVKFPPGSLCDGCRG